MKRRTSSVLGAVTDGAAPTPATATQTLPLVPRAIEDGIVTMTGPRFCAVLETGAVNLTLLHPDELGGLASAYHGFLASLSFPVQLLVRVQPADPTPYLHWYQAQTAGRAAADPALRWLVTRHLAHVERLVAATMPLAHRFYVVVPAPEGTPAVATRARRGSDVILRHWPRRRGQHDAPSSAAPADACAVAEALAERCDLIATGLGAAGVSAHRLDDTELAALWYACLSPQNAAAQPLPPDVSVAAMQPVATLDVPHHHWPSNAAAAEGSTALPP